MLRKISVFADRTCSKCGKTIEKGLEALADFDGHPYRFYHPGCLQTPKDERIEGFEEVVLAVLQDHSTDLVRIKGMLRSIYEKEFPTLAQALEGKDE